MRKPCCDKQENNKGAWSRQEDQKLVDYIQKHGEGCWRTLPQAAGLLRCGKSCRLRWINYLRPDIKRGNFTEDEEDLIIKLHALLGNRWSLIAGRLPGRTDNEVKNYWNSHLRRKLINMGIDPNNHRLNHKPFGLKQNPQCPNNGGLTSSSNSQIQVNYSQHLLKLNCDNDRLSDAASCSENDRVRFNELPDLNLDLTISCVIPSHSCINVDHKQKQEQEQEQEPHEVSNVSLTEQAPTLLLFQ